MAAPARPNSDGSRPPPLLTKRDKYSIALITTVFLLISGLTHLMLGGLGAKIFVFPAPAPEKSPTVIVIEPRRLKPSPSPMPTPQPTPTPKPAQTPSVHATVQPHSNSPRPDIRTPSPGTPAPSNSGPPVANPSAGPVGPPSSAPPSTPPQSTPEPRRVIPEIDAVIVRKVLPVYPAVLLEQGLEGTVVLLVTIGPDGQLVAASIAQSSGQDAFDQAALRAARATTFKAPIIDGRPGTETYRMVYTFQLGG